MTSWALYIYIGYIYFLVVVLHWGFCIGSSNLCSMQASSGLIIISLSFYAFITGHFLMAFLNPCLLTNQCPILCRIIHFLKLHSDMSNAYSMLGLCLGSRQLIILVINTKRHPSVISSLWGLGLI